MVLLSASSADSPSSTTTQVSGQQPGSWMGARGGNFSGPWMGGRNGNFSGPPQGMGFPPSFSNGGRQHFGGNFGALQGPPANLTIGQIITLTSTNGSFVEVDNPSDNGTASGTLALTVTGKLSEGYTFSISSGSFTISGTQYTISSGSAQTGLGGNNLQGQGSTSSSGDFLVQLQARGSLAGTNASVHVDLKTGSTEYMVNLLTSVQN